MLLKNPKLEDTLDKILKEIDELTEYKPNVEDFDSGEERDDFEDTQKDPLSPDDNLF
jgi:hypothetical protein